MKKLALALVAATTFAGAASADITTGFYLGAGVGANSISASQSSSTLGRNRFEGSIYGGYGYVTGCTYVGGELGYTFTGGKITATNNNAGIITTASIERRNIINAAFLIGQKFSPSTMIYARLGMNSTQYKPFLSVAGRAAPSDSKRKISFAPGVGIEGAITKNVRVRLQYVYDLGNSIHGSSKIKSQATTLGVAYKF